MERPTYSGGRFIHWSPFSSIAYLCADHLKMFRLKGDSTGIGKKAGLFAKIQPGRARKRINAT